MSSQYLFKIRIRYQGFIDTEFQKIKLEIE